MMFPSMKITKIKKGKKRYNLYIEDEFSLAVSEETLLKLDIYEGKEIDEEQLERISSYEDRVRARDYALNLLSYRPRTRKELLRRLKRKKINAQIAEETIASLERSGLVDDYEFAKYYIESFKEKRGMYRLRNELIKLGADKSVIEKALEEIPLDEKETATKLIEKWLRTHSVKDEKAEKRLIDYLIRRGISWDTISDMRDNIRSKLIT